MAFINDHQIVVAPVELGQVDMAGIPAIPRQVGMIEHIVAQAVCSDGIVQVVFFKCMPVIAEFLWAENEHGAIAQFVILDHGQGGECFTQTHAVGKDAAVVLLQLIDNCQCCISLKGVQLVPDRCFLKSRGLIGQDIFADIFEKLTKNIVDGHKVDEFRGIFIVGCRDAVDDLPGDILEQRFVAPDHIKTIEELFTFRMSEFNGLHRDVVAAFTAEISGGKAVDRRVREAAVSLL